jgi:ribosomal protein S18 acetylase RimI-like enzyme
MAPCTGLIHLRHATPADAKAIATVHVRTWQAAYRGLVPQDFLDGLSIPRRETWWREELSVTPNERMPWIAESDTGIAGFVSVGASRDPDADARTGEVYAIYVDPDCWNRGIGRNLLQHGTRDLKGAGNGKATLWVLASNDRARTFYEAAGWRTDGGTQTIELGGSSLVEVRYTRDL